MLKNLWYAVEFSQVVTDRPQLVQLFDQQIVIYRDDQKVLHALDNTCPHRGASLANGTIKENCLVCPYHGWHFQGDGHCVKIPANAPNASIPRQAVAKTYPVQEQDGWVWLFWGDGASDFTIPAISQNHDPKFRLIQGDFRWQVNYERAIEMV